MVRAKHPRLEGLRHSLMWIEDRIKKEVFVDEDLEQLAAWIKQLATRVSQITYAKEEESDDDV